MKAFIYLCVIIAASSALADERIKRGIFGEPGGLGIGGGYGSSGGSGGFGDGFGSGHGSSAVAGVPVQLIPIQTTHSQSAPIIHPVPIHLAPIQNTPKQHAPIQPIFLQPAPVHAASIPDFHPAIPTQVQTIHAPVIPFPVTHGAIHHAPAPITISSSIVHAPLKFIKIIKSGDQGWW